MDVPEFPEEQGPAHDDVDPEPIVVFLSRPLQQALSEEGDDDPDEQEASHEEGVLLGPDEPFLPILHAEVVYLNPWKVTK